ncbi:MAG TPA: HNH endonuclease signature motif containing protein [Geobacterales bacterium]|nr:HNH endonuclease signature motif containing protein [Geobacterales bacterium]
MSGFISDVTEQELKRQKEKGRELRKSRWWQNRIARGICHYCGQQVGAEELTMDHLVPLVRGGTSSRGNVVPACKECNNRKKYLLPLEWEEYLQRLAAKDPDDEGGALSGVEGEGDQ